MDIVCIYSITSIVQLGCSNVVNDHLIEDQAQYTATLNADKTQFVRLYIIAVDIQLASFKIFLELGAVLDSLLQTTTRI